MFKNQRPAPTDQTTKRAWVNVRVGWYDTPRALEMIQTSPPWSLRDRSIPMKGREEAELSPYITMPGIERSGAVSRTMNVTRTRPALAKVSTAGIVSPTFNGRLRPSSIR